MTNEERIKADAEKYFPCTVNNSPLHVKAVEHQRIGYIAGATAENAYMQPVIDAAEKVAKIFAHDGEHGTCAICQLARALKQWKSGKGVGDG